MSTPTGDIRIRRPQQHEPLLKELRDDGTFPTYRDILLFAAALGAHVERRVEFTGTGGDPIRYDQLTVPGFSDALINMLAARAKSDEPEIMDASRLAERLRIFEEYANGGLEYIQEQMNVRQEQANLVVVALTTEALAHTGGAQAVSVDELLSGINWERH